MSIPQFIASRFERLARPAASEDICVMECFERTTGVSRYLICSVLRMPDGDYMLAPLGEVFDSERADAVYEQVQAP